MKIIVLFLSVPSRGPVHRFPVDCWRFYPDSMAALARYGKVKLLDTCTSGSARWGDIVGVFQKEARS